MLKGTSRRGFTLLELIVVIVILGILAAIAIPTFKQVITTSQDRSSLATLKAVARDVQMLRALSQSTSWDAVSTDTVKELGSTWVATADAGTDPKAKEITYMTDGANVFLALRSSSQNVCVVGISPNAVIKDVCGKSDVANGTSTLRKTVSPPTSGNNTSPELLSGILPGYVFPTGTTAAANYTVPNTVAGYDWSASNVIDNDMDTTWLGRDTATLTLTLPTSVSMSGVNINSDAVYTTTSTNVKAYVLSNGAWVFAGENNYQFGTTATTKTLKFNAAVQTTGVRLVIVNNDPTFPNVSEMTYNK